MRRGMGTSPASTLDCLRLQERRSMGSCRARDQFAERHLEPGRDLGKLVHIPGDISSHPRRDGGLRQSEDGAELALRVAASGHAGADLARDCLGGAL